MKNTVVIAILVIVSFFSCKKNDAAAISHPSYFDPAFENAARISHVDPDRAFYYLDSVFKSFPSPGIKDLYRKYSFKVNYAIENSAQNAATLACADSMLLVLGNHLYEREFAQDYANAFLKKAILLMWKRDYSGAFYCSSKARLAMEQTNDSCALSNYTFMLGTVSYQQHRDLDAVRYNLQGLKEISSCTDEYWKFKLTQGKLDDIGLSYNRHNMLDSALWYYKADLAYLDAHKHAFPDIANSERFDDIAKGVVYGNIGDIFLKKGDTSAAEKFYGQDINILPGNDPGDGQCTLLKLVNIYLVQHNLPKANKLLQQIKESLDQFPDLNNQLKWYRLQLVYLNDSRQSQLAYQYIQPYLRLKDSLDNLKQMPSVDMEKEYELTKNQNEVAQLTKQDVLKNRFILFVFICSVLAVAMTALLYYYWKRSKRQNEKISKQNEEMQLTLNSLTESQKENTQMMQVVAHDLRNPISSMISVTSLILENDNLSADDREMLELMQIASYNAIEMISDLLNINTTADGIKKEQVDIYVLLRYCADLLKFKASEKGQLILLDTDHATLLLNREKMWRVFSNLLVNAMKFSGLGKTITIHGRKKATDYLITITDQGIGIPDKYKPRIFDMFSEAQRPGTEGEKSYGMGLAISKQIVEAHGGRIWFESQEGAGTSFFISIPLL
jgi:signal transduction histidine kinase